MVTIRCLLNTFTHKIQKDEDWQDFINYSADERKLLQNSLGNLLPLSFSINSSLQNTCFKDKKNQKLDAKR